MRSLFFSKCLEVHQLLFFVRGVRSFVLAGVFRGRVLVGPVGLGGPRGAHGVEGFAEEFEFYGAEGLVGQAEVGAVGIGEEVVSKA